MRASGQYAIVDGEGKRIGREATVVEGEPFPPTPESAKVSIWLTAQSTKIDAETGDSERRGQAGITPFLWTDSAIQPATFKRPLVALPLVRNLSQFFASMRSRFFEAS